ncbi:MAG: ABC transporter permease subunit [Candidatus Caldatribacteriota bacterium]|nr:ABC transporter permease subunit [Atribacterota bacterium]MDD4765314.1 ABC transporter permease subunit [Atribacterota bacterium]MDI9596231.1 ABC transporter permease subunit [Atribacterota bacterium]
MNKKEVKKKNKPIVKKTIEMVLFIFFLFILFAPIFSILIWSVAIRWYWPNTMPQEIGFDYWLQALGVTKNLTLGAVNVLPAFFLSLGIAIIVVIISMLVSVPAGYALSKLKIPHILKGLILILFLLPRAFPQQPVFLNLMLLFNKVGLNGTVTGVILVHLVVGLVYAVWITTSTFNSIPPELEEAARSIGASRGRAFLKVTLPLAAPGLIASAVFVFLQSMFEFTGTFFVGLPFVTTLPMTLYSASGSNIQFASVIAILLLIPSIIFMFIIQKLLKAEYIGGISG